ncbi:MAG TPA: hypothetical protein VEI02_06305 [Planctomycetota bacterium]|nr:hypothetical protein [Planctomycetota bacterium]
MEKTLCFWDVRPAQFGAWCDATGADITFESYRAKLEHDVVWSRRAGFEVAIVEADVGEVLRMLHELDLANDHFGRSQALAAIRKGRERARRGATEASPPAGATTSRPR